MKERIVFGIVVAAGIGSRFGGDTPKQLLELGGQTVVARSVMALVDSGSIDAITVVAHRDHVTPVEAALEGFDAVSVVVGGPTRVASVRAGLAALGGTGEDIVVVHDAARPLVLPDQVAALVAALETADAATLAIPVADTVLVVAEGTVSGVPERSTLYRAQTPQGFRLGVLRAAHESAAADAGFLATDDCAVIRRYAPATEIAVVAGSEDNIKITTPADLDLAHRLLGGR